MRAFLAEHAHDHLVAVTGEDLGKDVAAWSQWLEEEGETLEPVPWPGFTEPKSVWHETILVPRDPQPEPRVSIYRYRPGRQPSIDV